MFGLCLTHILNTGCAEIWKKKVRRQKVNFLPTSVRGRVNLSTLVRGKD